MQYVRALLLGGQARAVEQLVAAEQVVARNLGLRDFRLRAVGAILRAQAALGVHQEIELHLVAEPAAANAVRGRQQIEQLIVRAIEHGKGLFARKRLAGQNVVGQLLPDTGRYARGFVRSRSTILSRCILLGLVLRSIATKRV